MGIMNRVRFIPVEVNPEIGVCGGSQSAPAHPYFRNFSARLKHTLMNIIDSGVFYLIVLRCCQSLLWTGIT